MTIAFRPHHFLCALCFQGKGYSPTFIANFTAIMAQLNGPAGDATEMLVVNQTDAICAPCPHRLDTQCSSQETISVLDNGHAQALNLDAGMQLTWGEAKAKIREHLSLETFHSICASCSWKEYGICENVLREFLKPD